MPTRQCQCGQVIEFDSTQAGQVVQCPSCGRSVRLPGLPQQGTQPPAAEQPQEESDGLEVNFEWDDSDFVMEGDEEEEPPVQQPPPAAQPPAAESPPEPAWPVCHTPPEQEGEAEFDWDGDLSLDGDEKGAAPPAPAAPQAEPPAPQQPAAPAEQPQAEAGQFDWGDEFSMDEEPPAAPAQPAAPQQPAEAPQQPAAEGMDLEFGADEFSLDGGAAAPAAATDDDEVIDLTPGQVLSMSAASAKAAEKAGAAPGGKMKACPGCGKIITDNAKICADCGAALDGSGERKGAAAPGAPKVAGTYWGAFLYAYAAVFAGQGWKAWFKYLAIGLIVPPILQILAPFACLFGCVLMILAILIRYGAVIGAMYLYMGHAARHGAESLGEVNPKIMDDMVRPAGMVGCSSLLVWLLLAAGAGLAITMGAMAASDLDPQNLEAMDAAAILSIMASAGVLIIAVLLAMFIWPMILMVLGASQKITASLNPVNIYKAISKAAVPYLGIFAFFWANYMASVILQMVLSAMAGPARFGEPLSKTFLRLGLEAPALALAIYAAAVNGWRMGIFLYRNDKVFTHVR